MGFFLLFESLIDIDSVWLYIFLTGESVTCLVMYLMPKSEPALAEPLCSCNAELQGFNPVFEFFFLNSVILFDATLYDNRYRASV
jgi:hypothetical protein